VLVAIACQRVSRLERTRPAPLSGVGSPGIATCVETVLHNVCPDCGGFAFIQQGQARDAEFVQAVREVPPEDS
jgi:hypothetical protein